MTAYTNSIQRQENNFLSIIVEIKQTYKDNLGQLKREWTTDITRKNQRPAAK